jgi:hypothetical protein
MKEACLFTAQTGGPACPLDAVPSINFARNLLLESLWQRRTTTPQIVICTDSAVLLRIDSLIHFALDTSHYTV